MLDLRPAMSRARAVLFAWLSQALARGSREEMTEQGSYKSVVPRARRPGEDVVSREKARLPESGKADYLHATDFEIPLFNVWKQQTKTAGASHFGNSEVRWVDNLLYLYTQPFDVVVDPFGGGGSTSKGLKMPEWA